MGALLGQIGSLLTAPPGNLIYQLVLAFSVAGALQTAYVRWRANRTQQDGRAIRGLGAMLAALLVYFLVGIFVTVAVPSATTVLPPLDRTITLILFGWAIWIWAFPDPSRQPDLAILILSALALVAGVVTAFLSFIRPASSTFNQSLGNILWQLATLALLGVGAAVLYIRRNDGFANGLVFVGLAFLGHAIHLVLREPGDYSAIVRLAHIASFPLLLTLAQRVGPAGSEIGSSAAEEIRVPLEPTYQGPDPKTIHALLGLASEMEPARLHQALTRAVAHAMRADLAFLVLLAEDPGRLEFVSGYDLIREDYLEGAVVDGGAVEKLKAAIQAGQPLRLQAGGTAGDLRVIGDLLGLKEPGDLLSAPIVTAEGVPVGALVVLSPYSHRHWSTDDQNLLVSMAGAMIHLLQRRGSSPLLVREIEGLAESLEAKEDEILRLQRRNEDLTQQLEILALESNVQDSAGGNAAMLAIAEERAAALENQLHAIESRGASPAEEQLKESLKDLAGLQNQLGLAQQKIQDLESGASGDRRKKEQAEVIASISQELRQPMSSIIGYTDLLLGESVGILGALQRKFIERIKASTERIGGLINDMIQLTTLEVGLADLKPEAMDLNTIIDNALAYTSGQIREKKISIHLDLPKSVAPVNADREALQQILIHLLQNAGAATPMEGRIGLKVQTTIDEGQPYVLIQVTDTGGGIPEDDMPRVFTRLFRADNVLIEGVGDTGVGLSIAKTLTEAQHGRIWVESQPGSGATFCVLLPAMADAVGRMPDQEAH